MKNLTLSVIVPFFNEKKYLKSSVERLISVSIFKEIILVDDNSTDNSYSIAENLAHNVDNIQVFKNKVGKGKGAAVEYAKNHLTSTHMIIHDADLEYFPSDIVEMFDLAKNNPEVLILGTRYNGNKSRKNIYVRTELANRFLSFFFSLINLYKISDIASCYKMMPTEFFKENKFSEKGFAYDIEILTKYLKHNKLIIEHPIKYEGRSYSDGKKIKTSDGFSYLYNTLRYRFFS